jgi:hypothetical protein
MSISAPTSQREFDAAAGGTTGVGLGERCGFRSGVAVVAEGEVVFDVG